MQELLLHLGAVQPKLLQGIQSGAPYKPAVFGSVMLAHGLQLDKSVTTSMATGGAALGGPAVQARERRRPSAASVSDSGGRAFLAIGSTLVDGIKFIAGQKLQDASLPMANLPLK